MGIPPKYMLQVSADQVIVSAFASCTGTSNQLEHCSVPTLYFPARYLQWIPQKQVRILSRMIDEPYWLLAFLGTLCSIL